MSRNKLERLLMEGLSLEQIGSRLDLHPSTISYWLRKYGLAAVHAQRFAPRGAPDRARLTDLVALGLTLEEIADSLDRSVGTVRYWLRAWGIERPRTGRVDPATAPRKTERVCRHHGRTAFHLERRGYYRCSQCRQERVAERRRQVKRLLVEDAGGCCVACGYDACQAALQFHHRDPADKAFGLSSNGVARSLAAARIEAGKCVLLCANCHAEVESGHRMLPQLHTQTPRGGLEPP